MTINEKETQPFMQIGIDIGGTTVKIGLVDDEAHLTGRTEVDFVKGDPHKAVEMMAEGVNGLLAEHGLKADSLNGIGVVVPGSLSQDGHTVIDAFNLDFHDVDLYSIFREFYPGLPVYIANDADGAALAELYMGAFRGHDSGILLTLGTGLGVGIILNGKIFNGGMKLGTEMHVIIADGGDRVCTCGNRGCAEAYCAASALERDGREAAARHPESLMAQYIREGSLYGTRIVTHAVEAGDETAKEVFDAYVGHLGSLCASLFNMLGPEVIAVGGGLSGAGDMLFDPLRKDAYGKCFFKNHGELKPAVLGNDAGMLGAASLVLNMR